MKIKSKIKISFLIVFIILIINISIYIIIIYRYIGEKKFIQANMNLYNKNETEIFKIDKILLCSSANAVNNGTSNELKNLNIYQYTDIAVYIKNGTELTKKNTINKLYIDNIILDGNTQLGKKTLNYKNLLKFGLKEEIKQEKTQEQNINFNIISTNEENIENVYENPTFYTDCSNPITLEYLNYNLKENYVLKENNSISFDGSILKDAEISTKELECKVKFRINIINNLNEKYSCNLNIKIPLNDIYNGTTMKSKTTKEKEYIFFRQV